MTTTVRQLGDDRLQLQRYYPEHNITMFCEADAETIVEELLELGEGIYDVDFRTTDRELFQRLAHEGYPVCPVCSSPHLIYLDDDSHDLQCTTCNYIIA